ncbi:TetR/AcrR family transcriptional regulator [Actinomadura opuntiae]|uniref:TetR/AcrR family transcriptional regulator n=1 Tax=Actinomadura sp. OS1-43 TaxID=604315 RepID=UPI00255AE16A|nr:TetR family transcriptional regulator [Actinomadura sp. OS1-43]MDL4817220.1 TetR family transcriptional regulator [Actinomadura sp. OS1-43]
MPAKARSRDGARQDRAAATRELILVTAERLFAEEGLSVSNRQVSAAAGQGNNSSVGYHFGDRVELVRAILQRHSPPVERLRAELVADAADTQDLRVWLGCLVRPLPEYLASLPGPTFFARFGAQVMVDPGYRELVIEDAMSSPSLHIILGRLDRLLPDLPAPVRTQRRIMTRQLMIFTWAEHERVLAEDPNGPHLDWPQAVAGLIDALTGLWQAPVSE